MLSASRRTLRVYHTLRSRHSWERWSIASSIARRIARLRTRVLTVGSRIGDPKPTTYCIGAGTVARSAGLAVAKEDVSLLWRSAPAERFSRAQHPHLLVNNGQSTVVAATQTKNYTRDVVLRPGSAWPGYEAQTAQIEEGFSLEFHPLLRSTAKRSMRSSSARSTSGEDDPVMIDVPSQVAPRQKNRNQSPPDRQLQAPRAVSLAGRSGAADQSRRRFVSPFPERTAICRWA